MKSKTKIIIGIFAFAFLLTAASLGYNQLSKKMPQQSTSPSAASPAATQSVKRAAPNFTVQDINGNTVSFSDFKGKPVVINFWASWCPPCKAEMPDYEKMYKEYSVKGVVFMMVDVIDGSRETLSIAKKFLQDTGYTFTAYFDVKGSASSVYGISSLPTSVFVDRDGNVSSGYVGMMDAAKLKRSIEAILSQ